MSAYRLSSFRRFALNCTAATGFVTWSRTERCSRFGITPIAPSLRKYSTSFSPMILLKIKTRGTDTSKAETIEDGCTVEFSRMIANKNEVKGAVSSNWQASPLSHVIVASRSASSSKCWRVRSVPADDEGRRLLPLRSNALASPKATRLKLRPLIQIYDRSCINAGHENGALLSCRHNSLLWSLSEDCAPR